MRRLSLSLTLILCVSLMGLVFVGGCAKKAEPPPEPVADEPPPAPPPEPEPEPEPTVDPKAWLGDVNDIYFDFDKYELRADARAILQENARLMKENTGGSFVLEGHCDERGTEDYNMALGQRRADAVLSYLSDLGVSGSRLKTVSYGEERPFTSGHDEGAWAQNRRVHFRPE
jgi:peptidoglycan-associated lipoprotein